MNSEKNKNYTIEKTYKFLPLGYQVNLNFKEKEIARDKLDDFWFFLVTSFLDVEICNSKELKDRKGIISDKIFSFTYPKEYKATSGEILFLKGSTKENDNLELALKSSFLRSEKPNNYFFKIEREFKRKPDFYNDNLSLKENLLSNEIVVEVFRLSLLFFKSGKFGSIFGPTVGETFCLEFFKNKIKVKISKSGVKNNFDVNEFYLFSKVSEIYENF